MSAVVMFKPRHNYGDPHPNNGEKDFPYAGFYFQVSSTDTIGGGIGGYVTAEEFDWLAERIGTPKLAEAARIRLDSTVRPFVRGGSL